MLLTNYLRETLRTPLSSQDQIRHLINSWPIAKHLHTEVFAYRCSLPGLAGFASLRCKAWLSVFYHGGESGIRTHGTLLGYTRFPVVPLRPLGHLSLGGEGGIRTHVPCSSQDKSISSRPRYGHFGTSPPPEKILHKSATFLFQYPGFDPYPMVKPLILSQVV